MKHPYSPRSIAGSLPIVLSALFFSVPLVVFPFETTGVVLADFVLFFGVIAYLFRIGSIPSFLLTLAFVFGAFSVFLGDVQSGSSIIYRLGSLVFFIKPCFAYFAGRYLIFNQTDFELFVKWFKYFIFFVLLAMAFSIVTRYGGVFRAESELQVDILGLPVFGTYGVNSLATYLACCGFVALYPLQFDVSRLLRFVGYSSFLFCLVLVFLSLSREAILGFIVMIFFYQAYTGKGIRFLWLCFFIVLVSWPLISDSPFFEAKINQIVLGWESRDVDHISSGRLSLYSAALEGFVSSPFSGVSFGGFRGSEVGLQQFDDLSGLTPHNAFLVPIWKGGGVFGVVYLAFVFYVTIYAVNSSRGRYGAFWLYPFLLGYLLVLGNLWDVLMVPNLGALYFFLCGAVIRGIGGK